MHKACQYTFYVCALAGVGKAQAQARKLGNMQWEPLTHLDERIIAYQLKRKPRNLHGVARRCSKQCPQVSVNYPLQRRAADAPFFPTVFWLTCPEAIRRISRIEAQGLIEQLQDQINSNQSLAQYLRDSHLEYIYIRRSLLDEKMRAELQLHQTDLARYLEQIGIGGVRDFKGVKCLHMHYAHYLATRNNPLGQLVERMIQLSPETWRCDQCHQAQQPAGVAE